MCSNSNARNGIAPTNPDTMYVSWISFSYERFNGVWRPESKYWMCRPITSLNVWGQCFASATTDNSFKLIADTSSTETIDQVDTAVQYSVTPARCNALFLCTYGCHRLVCSLRKPFSVDCWTSLLNALFTVQTNWTDRYGIYTRSSATAEKQRVSCAYMRSWRAVSLR